MLTLAADTEKSEKNPFILIAFDSRVKSSPGNRSCSCNCSSPDGSSICFTSNSSSMYK